MRAEVLDQRQVRVTLTAPLDGESVTVNYRISNGLADAEGTITVVEIPEPAQLQPPITVDDTATVRVGDVVDIPVLDNDEQPEGKPITLLPELAEPLPDDAGLLFVVGRPAALPRPGGRGQLCRGVQRRRPRRATRRRPRDDLGARREPRDQQPARSAPRDGTGARG